MGDLKKPNIWQVTKSVLAAAIGVQSNKNRVQDFQSASIWPFILGGIIFTIAFVLILALLVSRLT